MIFSISSYNLEIIRKTIHVKWDCKPLVEKVKCKGPKTVATIIRTSYFLKNDCGVLINDIGGRDKGRKGKQ